ncbi:MAG TPA: tRNA-dihydrouridine synthase [Terriglobales bacterium]|jgi:nifR3 family TIM-barrel protein|nr:tRNA-dihydrouridine synthase [Terriglobales bacterium]
MDGVTDAPFRYITAKHGRPDVIFTEFVNVQSAFFSPQTLLKDFAHTEIERPLVAQIYGKTPEQFYRVAHIVCELGFDGLDINMGCPAKNVAASGCGAALIRTPELARDIIRAAKQGVRDWYSGQTLLDLELRGDLITGVSDANRQRTGYAAPRQRRLIPISVKTRLGYDRVIIEDWLRTLLGEELAAISLHGRTLQQGYRGDADWQSIARAVEVAKGSGTLILGNGDVKSLSDAHRRMRQTQVDGVLIGRGTQGDPWFFREKERVKAALRSQCDPVLDGTWVTLGERFRIILEHCEDFERFAGRSRFAAMRKHLTWYCRNFRGAAEMRAKMIRANSSADVRLCLQEYLESLPNLTSPSSFSNCDFVSLSQCSA